MCVLALGARPWRLWLRVEYCEGSYYHSRLRLVRLGLVLSVSRILLSVLLFAGAFTRLLDGRLDSVCILAQNLRRGRVLIKRFPFPQRTAIEKTCTFTLEPGSLTIVRGTPLTPHETHNGSDFFPEGVSVWAGFWACSIESGSLSACLVFSDPREIPKGSAWKTGF